MTRFYVTALAGVAPVALLASASAHAQDQQPPSDAASPAEDASAEDNVIVVTATRQGAQTLQDVPLAIQAFTGEQLQERGIQETTDLVTSIPGASVGEQVGSVIKTFSLRGVGAAGGVGDSPIGYYIDDVPFAIPNLPLAPPLRFVDIERIEVLRGPQGTLYGQGSAGGTIIYHTRDPDLDRVTARGETFIATMDDASDLNFGVSGAVSVPLVAGKLAVRVSGGYDKRAGYIDVYSDTPATGPLFEKDANDITNKDLRAVVLWQPNDSLSVRAQAAHWEPEQDFTQSINSLDPPQQFFSGSTRGYERGNFDLYSLSVEYDAGFAVLSSSTSYLDAEFGYLTGQTFGPLGTGSLFNGYDAHSFAQEVQLRSSDGPFNWLVGGFFQDAKGVFSFDANLTALVISGFNDTRTRNYSAFGEISYELFGGKVVPLVGIRFFKDNRRFNADSILTGSGSGQTKPDKLTWRANLSFYPTDDLTAFVTVSTGFRSGITQTPFQAGLVELSGIPSAIALDPDTLTNYEAGLKARLADGRLQVGLNVYHIDFDDLQFGLTPFGVAAFSNVGQAKTTGVDAEIRWQTPLEGLNLGAIANWNDSEFGEVFPAVTVALPNIAEGERLSSTADYNYRLDADFERPISDSLRFFWNGSAARIGTRVMYDGYVVPAYSLYNANLGVRTDTWELALFGENLADERGPSFVRNSLLFAGPYPRTIGLRLRANFD
ncbi:MAG: TonB-dependent receptor [Erythrobacter sp.]|nr:TonB-dependent receptor [Erythrobacter sp.]